MALMREAAAKTMREQWNARVAVGNLLTLIDDLINGRIPSISQGPCSRA